MKIQLWRNATIEIEIGNTTFLVDPMLGEKGSFGPFPWTDDPRSNPLVDLPFSNDDIQHKLKQVDAIFISHLHPDHWDEAAIEMIDKDKPIFCPNAISEEIKGYGFNEVQSICTRAQFKEIELYLTNGRHGKGEIEDKMGKVNGIVFSFENNSLYVVGDSIWCNEVKIELEKHEPEHIIIAGGAATFLNSEPVTMTTAEIEKVAQYMPNSKIWITHLESISPCTQDRKEINRYIFDKKLNHQISVLEDGEQVRLGPVKTNA